MYHIRLSNAVSLARRTAGVRVAGHATTHKQDAHVVLLRELD